MTRMLARCASPAGGPTSDQRYAAVVGVFGDDVLAARRGESGTHQALLRPPPCPIGQNDVSGAALSVPARPAVMTTVEHSRFVTRENSGSHHAEK